ncbi:hypothetical protein INS49_015849 [Diaporthe citri]|uniref:uncharacterized protein n=1 Tax=Diaporthe citri TaxID=83186 RepID=UPI001C804A90|nr:uncharacterized protein INS49_015849 [Diaporthe citri]KAG6356461.1 hypothetical protein INS49_015849 [Diaporthe citri]
MADAEVETKSGAEALDQAQQGVLDQQHQTADQPEPEASTTPSVEHRSQFPIREGTPETHEGMKSGPTEPEVQSVECEDLKPPTEIEVPESEAESVTTSEEVPEEVVSDGNQGDKDNEAAQDAEQNFFIQFLDNGGGHITRRPWHEILDLETERAKMSRQTDPPVETITMVATSLSSEWRRHMAPSELENLSSGFLTNPNYTMEIELLRVDIVSDHIKQALRQIVTYSPDSGLSNEIMFIFAPYCLFYHHWDAIKAYQRTFKGAKDYDESSGSVDSRTQKPGFKPCDEITYNHLTVLRNAIESQSLAAVLEEKKRHEHSPALATFSMLWLLLKPGTTVYTKIHGKLAACVIKTFDFSPPFSLRKESNAYRVQLWHLQYDGKVLGRHELARYISAFEGEKRLIDLEIIPAEHYDAHDEGCLRKSLEARGEKYFKFISGPRQVYYRGDSLGDVVYWYEDRAVLDIHAYYSYGMFGAGLHPGDAIIRRPLVSAVDDDTDDILDVECCSDIQYDTTAIDSIVMPDERKMIIKSLVYRFSDIDAINGKIPAPWTADFVQNKGEGQIFLLHGSPGVGKTLTAGKFKYFGSFLFFMLIDEADIYLEKRATSDLSRNSLVSIFLRTMEYYRGILFLTTNRVGHFDDAFVSRVHVVIRYENLSDKDRATIWTQFFNKLQAERGKYITISRKAKRYVLEDEEVTKIPWNGREIRNAFQTAVAFAEYRFAHTPADQRDEKACLEEEDFAKVCEMTGAFKHYLRSISGRDESMRVRSDQARNDGFGSRN